jgi:hypothetical protein
LGVDKSVFTVIWTLRHRLRLTNTCVLVLSRPALRFRERKRAAAKSLPKNEVIVPVEQYSIYFSKLEPTF